MLQLQAKNIDICRISKLVARYNINAIITDSAVTLNGDVSEELLTELRDAININTVQNFTSQEQLYIQKETKTVRSEELIQKNDLLYPKVKRGEVYLCDFGNPYGHEQGFQRYAIVIQNDDGNLHSPSTIVIACTTGYKRRLPVHYHCRFSPSNMIDYDAERVGNQENVIMAEQIQTVDKTRLRKYIGTLTPDFMNVIDGKIDISLNLNREVKKTIEDKSKKTNECKDVNMIQVQLLSFVDIKELLKISRSSFNDEVKAKAILDLFGFDFKKNGVEYLLKAIISSPENDYFNVETLSESVSRKEGVDKEEIKRLIVARVKERFGLRKAPTIDFIRLVNIFLVKQEVDY